MEGNKVVEIKRFSFNKGTAVEQFLSMVKEDFMLAIGDDKTDEDLFRSLPQQAYTLKVGEPSATARYYIRNPEEVLQLLSKLLQPVEAALRAEMK
jgi:trehalose 6-phosphate synthase/phosphatase